MNFLSFLPASWQTKAAGILSIAIGAANLAHVTAPYIPQMDSGAAITAIITGLGVFAAKQANVTGGTKPVTPEAVTRVEADTPAK